MIEIEKLSKRYRDLVAVNDISFNVAKGEIVGFLGPNGAGKSTTMKIITGFLPASGGTVKVAGVDVFEDPMTVRKSIGYLPEIPPVYPELTVSEYLRFVAKLKKIPKADLQSEIDRVIERLSLESVHRRLIRNLSKGYQQRTGFAQAPWEIHRYSYLTNRLSGLILVKLVRFVSLLKSLGSPYRDSVDAYSSRSRCDLRASRDH